MTQSRSLIRGGRIYDHDGDVHQPATADLLINGETIERIAPAIAPETGVEVIDAKGKLVIPGMVNAHYHSHDVLAKGLFEEMPFDVWTLHSNPGNYGNRSQREIRLRTLLGAAESLRNGITTIQDFLTVVPQDDATVDTVLSAYEEAGVRVVFAVAARDKAALDIAPFIPKDLPESIRQKLAGADRSAKSELDYVAGQIKRLGLKPTPRQTWALAPSAPQRCSLELLEGMAALSREHDLPVFTHVYETRPQAAAARVQSVSLLKSLADAGLMNEKLNLVHGVWLTPDDIAQLAAAGARVVHNPISNLKLKSGVAPILDLHRAGVEVALGCDNYSCAETQNIFIAMRMLCLLPAVTIPNLGRSMPPMRCAPPRSTARGQSAWTARPARSSPAWPPTSRSSISTSRRLCRFNSAARQLVFAEGGRAVETVFVAGKPVVRDGKLITLDEAALAAEAAEISPAFRRDAEALASRNSDLIAPLLAANRSRMAGSAWLRALYRTRNER